MSMLSFRRGSMTEEYKKSCEDELDWNSVDQLHESTLQISNRCFEYKKLCVGLIGIIVAALLKFGGEKLSPTMLCLIPLIISIGFWVCDSTAYYYQKSNRAVMNRIMGELVSRNQITNRTISVIRPSWIQSFFNPSMALYYYILLVCFIGIIYDNADIFKHTY